MIDGFKRQLKETGIPVHLDSEYCRKYQTTHENCKGCESESGCSRLAAFGCLYSGCLVGFCTPKDVAEGIVKLLNPTTTEQEIKQLF